MRRTLGCPVDSWIRRISSSSLPTIRWRSGYVPASTVGVVGTAVPDADCAFTHRRCESPLRHSGQNVSSVSFELQSTRSHQDDTVPPCVCVCVCVFFLLSPAAVGSASPLPLWSSLVLFHTARRSASDKRCASRLMPFNAASSSVMFI